MLTRTFTYYFTIKNALHLFARSLMLHTTAHKRNKSSQKKRSKSKYLWYLQEYKIFTHTHILSAHPKTKKIIRPISQIASCVPKETTRKLWTLTLPTQTQNSPKVGCILLLPILLILIHKSTSTSPSLCTRSQIPQ